MPTAIRTPEPRLSPRQSVKFVCLAVRLRYLTRRLNRASERVNRLGQERAGGRLLHIARRWLACHEEAAEAFGFEIPPEAEQIRAILNGPPSTAAASREQGI